MRCLLFALLACLLLGLPAPAHAAAGANERRTAQHFETIRDDPAKLRAFLLAMPKGADLHNHLSGAVPTERLIDYAMQDGLCVDTTTLAAMSPPCAAGTRPAADAATDTAFYTRILQAWSMEGFVAGGAQSGHDHFFATFGKFGAVTGSRSGDILADVVRINAAQNVQYLETLISRQGGALGELAQRAGFDPDFAALRRKLIAGGIGSIARAASADTDADVARFNALLRCGTAAAERACRMAWRYDFQVRRGVAPELVFAQLMLGFMLQRTDRRYVGVNLVQPEDGAIALRDYTLQMRMIRYLRGVYPRAHVTLHAGELAPGLVDAGDLRFHIRQAVDIAGAERIGHGVDLVHETGYELLLRRMARRGVLVEAPLTSNAQILGVSGAAHPFPRYRAAGVPVALATDDPGVSRIDLTHEYAFATTQYDLTYGDLKELARASLEHAFLPGRSLFRTRGAVRRVAACARDVPGAGRLTARCRAFLRASAKAAVQWEQEGRLNTFERRRR